MIHNNRKNNLIKSNSIQNLQSDGSPMSDFFQLQVWNLNLLRNPSQTSFCWLMISNRTYPFEDLGRLRKSNCQRIYGWSGLLSYQLCGGLDARFVARSQTAKFGLYLQPCLSIKTSTTTSGLWYISLSIGCLVIKVSLVTRDLEYWSKLLFCRLWGSLVRTEQVGCCVLFWYKYTYTHSNSSRFIRVLWSYR